MLVGNRMTKSPITVTPEDNLSLVRQKMDAGGFRRLPVVSAGRVVGIISDRDLREHSGYLERTKVNVAMAERPITVSPGTTLEEAARILLERKIGGMPVIDDDRLVGIITISDVLKAFLHVMGALEDASSRIDFLLEGEEHGFSEASRIVSREGGEIAGVGTYRARWQDSAVCYLRLLSGDPERIAKALRARGFNILGTHSLGVVHHSAA